MPRKAKRPRRYLVVIPLADGHRVYDVSESDYRQHLTIESMVGWVVWHLEPRHVALLEQGAREFVREIVATEHKQYQHEIVYLHRTQEGFDFVTNDPSAATLTVNHKNQNLQ